jgi:hypothetical protein
MKRSVKILSLVLALTFAVLPLAASRVNAAAIDFPGTPFTIITLGDITKVLKEGVPQAIVLRGQELAADGVYVTVNGIPYTAYVLLGSNLTLLPGTTPLKFEHKGTIDFTINGNLLSLKYTGLATKDIDMMTHVKTLNSYGEFVITNGAGGLAGLVGTKGTYTLTLVCRGVPGEHLKVGSVVDVTFTAKGM